MNETKDVFGDDIQIGLDRLADGELTSDEQRGLIMALENQPDGWRRCALAFVESQAWRGELRRITAVGGTVNQPISINRSARRNTAIHALRWLAVATSVLVAFTLGIAAHSWWPAAATNQPAKIVTVPPEEPIAASPEKYVAAVAEPNSTGAVGSAASGKWQALKVTIPTADGQGEQTVEVPLVAAGEQEVKSMLAKQQPLLSDVALQALESTGHEVQQHRAYYPVQLQDGMQAVLPVDFVEVRDTSAWQ
jgi:hypothetical protein